MSDQNETKPESFPEDTQEAAAEPKRGAVDTGRRVDVTLRRAHADQPPAPKKPKPQAPKPPVQEHKVKEPNGFHPEEKVAPVKEDPIWQAPLTRPEPKEWDDSGDFAAMLDEAAPVQKLNIEVGKRVRARVIHISKDNVFFSLGQKHEGAMSLGELIDAHGVSTVKVGDYLDVFVVGIDETIHLSKKVGRFAADLGMLEDARANQIPVEGKITSVNTGGVEVSLAGARAFCPIGQVDINFVEDPSSLIGKTMTFIVKQISNGGRNIVLSRRALLERERGEKAKERLATLQVGDRVNGVITRVADFGAFADLGGIDGLIPVSELGFGHGSVQDRVKIGDAVTVDVLRIEPDPKRPGQLRISLSLKAALPDPFEAYSQYLVAGASLEGRVARLETFGAFIELFPGIDGLIHISELSEQRVRHPEEVLKAGEPVTVRVIEFDPTKRRVSLSLREYVERGAKSDGPGAPASKRGELVDGVVERIERYGVFVKLSSGVSALLPASESGQPRGADLGKVLPIGTQISLMVIDIDDRGRVRVSKIAREKAEEQDLVRSFAAAQGGGGLGTLGDLLKARMR